MLDYIQRRDALNRNTSTDRRGEERRGAERRGDDRRQTARRAASNQLEGVEGVEGVDKASVKHERRVADRRQAPRRDGERRNAERRAGERRLDPSRMQRFPLPDGGFLTPEERDFLMSFEDND